MNRYHPGRRSFIIAVGFCMMERAFGQESGKPDPGRKSEGPSPRLDPALLMPGCKNILRIRQVLPHDGLAPGDRLLNSQPDLQIGDRFLAELGETARAEGKFPGLIGGEVERIDPPGRFGKNGKLLLRLSQLIRSDEETISPWVIDTTDLTKHPHLKRALINALFMGEGAGIGLTIASQFSFSNVNPLNLGLGAGVGLLVGMGLAAMRRGTVARLEPGDTYEVEVGSCRCRALPGNRELKIYPATAPGEGPKK